MAEIQFDDGDIVAVCDCGAEERSSLGEFVESVGMSSNSFFPCPDPSCGRMIDISDEFMERTREAFEKERCLACGKPLGGTDVLCYTCQEDAADG